MFQETSRNSFFCLLLKKTEESTYQWWHRHAEGHVSSDRSWCWCPHSLVFPSLPIPVFWGDQVLSLQLPWASSAGGTEGTYPPHFSFRGGQHIDCPPHFFLLSFIYFLYSSNPALVGTCAFSCGFVLKKNTRRWNEVSDIYNIIEQGWPDFRLC